MIARAYCYVEMARAQQLLHSDLILRALNDVNNKLNHSERSYTFVVDYGQNMEIPVFINQQPGVSYYYRPLSIYNLGMVDQAHNIGNGKLRTTCFTMSIMRVLVLKEQTMSVH